MRAELVGVSKAVRESEVYMLSDREQDEFIREVALALTEDLRKFTGDAMPLSEAAFQVSGPHPDPLQGLIHVHTLAAQYDLDALPRDSDAYRVHVLEADGTTQGNTQPGVTG